MQVRSASGISRLRLNGALRRVVPGVGALARDAVVLGLVPRDQRLPHVVVREVAVLVVRRVEVREVEATRARSGQLDRVAAVDPAAAREQLRDPQGQPLVGPGRPLLEVRHLHPDRGVDPVRGLDQAGEEDGVQRRSRVVGLDRGADRVDPGAVLGPQVPRRPAERLGEVAGAAVERVEPGRSAPSRLDVDRVPVGLDVAAREDLGVAGGVDARSRCPPRRLNSWATRVVPVNRSSAVRAPDAREHLAEHRHQPSLRAEVLDHRRRR